MGSTFGQLATREELIDFNQISPVAYRELTTGEVVNLCNGDVEMLEECRKDYVLPSDFHSGLVDNFLGALHKIGVDYGGDGFWSTKPEGRLVQFELIPAFLEPEGGEAFTIDPIRVLRSGVVVACFAPFKT